MTTRGALFILSVLFVSGCALHGPTLQIPSHLSSDVVGFRERQITQLVDDYATSRSAYVDSLAYPMMVSSLGICDNQGAGRRFGLRYEVPRAGGPPAVISVTPGSAAERDGLQAGDLLIGAQGVRFYGLQETRIMERLDEAFESPTVDLSVLRVQMNAVDTTPTVQAVPPRRGEVVAVGVSPDHPAREEIAVTLTADLACAFDVTVVSASSVNAYADGQGIYISTGLLDFVENERELQFILAHELAHNMLDHTERTMSNARKGALLGALLGAVVDVGVTAATRRSTDAVYTETGANIGMIRGVQAHSKDFEREADYLALYVLARAGISLDGIEDLWVRFDAEVGESDGWSHPSYDERYSQLIAGREEILNKIAAGDARMVLQPNKISGN